MMHFSQETANVLNIFVTIIHVFAVCLTILRLYHRYDISRLWWDDYFAAVAGIADCVAIINFWLGLKSDKSFQSWKSVTQMAKYLIGFFSIVTVQWATRIALALAFARIFPPRATTRRYAISLAVLFLCLYIAAVIQAALFCRNISAWISSSMVQCGQMVIFLVAVMMISDILLFCSPLYALRRLRLPDEQRRLIFASFAGSILMLMSCVATTIFQFAPATWEPARSGMRVVLALLEGSISLIVCNLLVIVTYFYKVLRQERVIETPPQSTQSRPQGMSETDFTGGSNPLRTEEYETTFNFTEISEAYDTEPSLTSRSDRVTIR